MIHFHTLPFFVYAFHHCGYPVLPYLRFLRSSESRFRKISSPVSSLVLQQRGKSLLLRVNNNSKGKNAWKAFTEPGTPSYSHLAAVFFAFWRISENPKQLPKCHDDSWSIDVSSWFSHGKIVEDICRT